MFICGSLRLSGREALSNEDICHLIGFVCTGGEGGVPVWAPCESGLLQGAEPPGLWWPLRDPAGVWTQVCQAM